MWIALIDTANGVEITPLPSVEATSGFPISLSLRRYTASLKMSQ